MAENRGYGFGSFEQGESNWPGADKTGAARYQPYEGYNQSSAWPGAESFYMPKHILEQAEARVRAQKRFFKSLFIYLGIISAVWIIGISTLVANYAHPSLVSIFVPLFITAVGGVFVAWNYFNAFIWQQRSHEERVMREAQKLVN